MKRVLSIVFVCVMLVGMLAACGTTEPTTGATNPSTNGTTAPTVAPTEPTVAPTTAPTEPSVQLPASALEMMQTIYDAWDFEYKAYFMGGGYSNPVEGAPGAVDATDTDTLQYLMYVPEACVADVLGAASYVHSMNYSVFTSGAFKVADAAAFCAKMKEGLDSTQWMCGIPETLMLYTLGNEYVLFAMGTAENMDTFRPAVQAAYPDAVAFFDGLMG